MFTSVHIWKVYIKLLEKPSTYRGFWILEFEVYCCPLLQYDKTILSDDKFVKKVTSISWKLKKTKAGIW